MCVCGAAFTRRDLLTRHHRLSSHHGQAEDQQSTPDSALRGLPDSEPLPGLGQTHVWSEPQNAPGEGAAVTNGEGMLDAETQPYAQQQLIVPQPMFEYCT